MKKYIVTSEHPEIKEGVIISSGGHGYSDDCLSETKSIWLDTDEIKDQLEKGWIKEYKKERPELTIVDHHYLRINEIIFTYEGYCVPDHKPQYKEISKAIKKYLNEL